MGKGAGTTGTGNYCSAPFCTNNRKKDKENGEQRSYYCFPTNDSKRMKLWLQAMPKINWSPKKYERICSAHFKGGQKTNVPGSMGYVPTIFDTKEKQATRNRVSKTSQRAGIEPEKVSSHSFQQKNKSQRKKTTTDTATKNSSQLPKKGLKSGRKGLKPSVFTKGKIERHKKPPVTGRVSSVKTRVSLRTRKKGGSPQNSAINTSASPKGTKAKQKSQSNSTPSTDSTDSQKDDTKAKHKTQNSSATSVVPSKVTKAKLKTGSASASSIVSITSTKDTKAKLKTQNSSTSATVLIVSPKVAKAKQKSQNSSNSATVSIESSTVAKAKQKTQNSPTSSTLSIVSPKVVKIRQKTPGNSMLQKRQKVDGPVIEINYEQWPRDHDYFKHFKAVSVTELEGKVEKQ